jgi:two-component system NarL family sensor kinase
MWSSKRSRDLAISHAQLESVILERTAELQRLSQRLLRVQDEERRKIARDLHDSTGQTLAALRMTIAFLQMNCKSDAQMTTIASELAVLADQAIDEVRTMSYLLHPPLLDEVGFACAADWYIEGFAKRSKIHVRSDLKNLGERLPRNIEIVLFRVLQESLTNVHRHSGASEVSISVQRDDHTVIMELHDFGCGIAPDRLLRLRETSAESGVGLAGMRERLNELNGKFELESDGKGTTVRATVFLTPPSQPTGCEDSDLIHVDYSPTPSDPGQPAQEESPSGAVWSTGQASS